MTTRLVYFPVPVKTIVILLETGISALLYITQLACVGIQRQT